MDTPIAERTDIAGVIDAELEEIARRRGDSSATPPTNGAWEASCDSKKFFGICISGGGIRSATFALGVLQSLAEKCLLQKADYLSTVSGGGYIGSWLQGILKRPNDAQGCYQPLTEDVPKPPEEDPITFLRSYSNYLSPRHGLSIDSLMIPVIWFRNTVLNQAIIVAAVLMVFLLSFWPGELFREAVNCVAARSWGYWSLAFAALPGLFAVIFMARNLHQIAKREFLDKDARPFYKRDNSAMTVWIRLVFPIFVGVLFMMWAVFGPAASPDETRPLWFGGALLFLLYVALQLGGGFTLCYVEQRKDDGKCLSPDPQKPVRRLDLKVRAGFHVLWMSVLSAGFTLLLLWGVSRLIRMWHPKEAFGSQSAIAWGPPLFVLALMAGMILQIGLMGRDFPDASREWLARAGTLFLTTAVFWAGYFATAVFAPYGIAAGWEKYRGRGAVFSALLGWLGTTAASVLAGKSAKTSIAPQAGEKKQGSTTLEWIARFGPFIAIGGFLILVAFAAQSLLRVGVGGLAVRNYWQEFSGFASTNPLNLPKIPIIHTISSIWWALGLPAGAAAVFLVLSVRVNINEFSMHHFYKNRLVRCYLGASAARSRRPDWFTGFDSKDDFPLGTLAGEQKITDKLGKTCKAPYPILNATVNVTVGTELATQDRKGLSWIFTPLYSGFAPARSKEQNGKVEDWPPKTYARTSELSSSGGIALGTAMAISGAAANPNWGSHSSPQTAFLLTLFDVRLGWWVGNPEKSTFKRSGPRVALTWLIRELFGDLDEKSGYLNLSDGGHFENLGLYELVRRRCRYIIALDGEQDAEYRFESLGGAVRKCRADFGVDIVINPRPIQMKDGLSSAHCVVGRIHYPEPEYPEDYPGKKSEKPQPGWLLYIKSSITGDEPADVEEYRREHPDFPQQSTADQFFTEAQFESYRMLGAHAGRSTLDWYKAACGPVDLEELFTRLSARWEVPPQAPTGAFSRHAEAYANLMSRLADHPELKAIDDAVVEGMPANQEQKDRLRLLFWLDLIQLAENIFVDLNLADQSLWNHPMYAGWKRVFEYWARSEQLKDVWMAQRESFGKAFRYFFNDLTGSANGPSPKRSSIQQTGNR